VLRSVSARLAACRRGAPAATRPLSRDGGDGRRDLRPAQDRRRRRRDTAPDQGATAVSASTMTISRLSDTVAAEVGGVTTDQLAADASVVSAVRDALEAHGVLVFRDLHLEPEDQIAFCSRLGEIDFSSKHHLLPGIFLVTLDPTQNRFAEYLHGTFF